MAVNYDIDYNDERFSMVEADRDTALSDLEETYAGMIGESDKYYQDQIAASKEWADTQSQLQQEQTDFTIEKIEQQKDQEHKDYLKEQSASYVDWQKQSNAYGAEAEKMATAGLTGTGYSESSQVSMYNTYQNRVATAREAFKLAIMNYDNNIKEAKLQNNSILAEIAYQAQQQQLELSLQGFQYKNQLILEQANKKIELDNIYYNRYMDVLNQINTENALAEDIRQFDENIKFQAQQAELDRNFKTQQAELDRQHDIKVQNLDQQFKAAQAELDRKHDKAMLDAKTEAERKLAEEQHKRDLEKLQKQYENQKKLAAQEHANDLALLKAQNEAKAPKIVYKEADPKAAVKKDLSTEGARKEKIEQKTDERVYQAQLNHYNAMVRSGMTKSQVLSDIEIQYKKGAMTKATYTKLKSIFNVKGFEY